MTALGTGARRTAFRKLKEIPYRASYSHRGRYYTLDELIDFDQHGLWSFHDVRFSVAGTLATAAAMVSDAPAGQFRRSWTTGCTSAPRMPCVSWFSSAS